MLACGEPVQSGRSMKQEPTEATLGRLRAATERSRNPPPKDGGGCQSTDYEVNDLAGFIIDYTQLMPVVYVKRGVHHASAQT